MKKNKKWPRDSRTAHSRPPPNSRAKSRAAPPKNKLNWKSGRENVHSAPNDNRSSCCHGNASFPKKNPLSRLSDHGCNWPFPFLSASFPNLTFAFVWESFEVKTAHNARKINPTRNKSSDIWAGLVLLILVVRRVIKLLKYLNFYFVCHVVAAHVVKVGELRPAPRPAHSPLTSARSRRHVAECWHVIFAPDETRFAWLCGTSRVLIVPWNRFKNCL